MTLQKRKAKKYYNHDKEVLILICEVLLSWKIKNKLIGKKLKNG